MIEKIQQEIEMYESELDNYIELKNKPWIFLCVENINKLKEKLEKESQRNVFANKDYTTQELLVDLDSHRFSRKSHTQRESLDTLSYWCFYLYKMYQHVEKMQEWKFTNEMDMYFIWEKLWYFLRRISQIWIEQFQHDMKWICLQDLVDMHYMNIA